MLRKILVFVVGSFLTGNAFALNLKEKKVYNEWKTFLSVESTEGFANEVVKKCGYEIHVDLDEKVVQPFLADGAAASLYCNSALESIAALCEDKDAKPLVKKNITKLSCEFGKKGETSFKLDKGTFVFTFGLGSSNLNDKVKEFLENNLN